MERVKPISASSVRTLLARFGSLMMMVSVISSSSRWAGTAQRARAAATVAGSEASRRLRVDRLTATDSASSPRAAARSRPFAALTQRGIEHPCGHRLDEARPLGLGDELVGHEQSPGRVAPPDEGLDTVHLERGHVRFRLVVEHEFLDG